MRTAVVAALSLLATLSQTPAARAQQRMTAAGAEWTVVAPLPAESARRTGPGYPVRVDLAQMDRAARDGGTMTVSLTDGLTVTATIEWSEARDGHLFVAGRLSSGDGEVTLTAIGDTVAGRVVADGRLFTIARDADSAVHRVTEVDQRSLPPEALPREAPPIEVALAEPHDAAVGDTNEFVDLLIVYTPAARTAAGGTSQILALLNGAKDNANLALANAHVTHRFRVAHAEEVTYTETNNMSTTLTRLRTSGDGFLDGVQALRDLYRADVVTILTTDNDACGLGYLMGSGSVGSGFESFAYNVVLWSCANGNLSMAHEIGHNMGVHHDRANAGGSSPAFTYAYGYAVPGLARDVMAYPCASNCPRLAIYSTPLDNFPGTATTAGTATEDNARALDNTSLVVANFRQSCSYSLTAASASFGEGGGGGSVGLTTTAGCAWTATSNDGFLTVSPASASGSGSQTINFTVAANVGAVNVTTSTRVGSLTIAGLAFSVTQTGCGFSISPSGEAFGAVGGSGTVGVTTPSSCSWSVSSLPAWVTTSSGGSGTGSGNWQYNVAANAGTARNAMVAVASLMGNFSFAQFAAGVNPKVMTAGTRSRFTIADNSSTNLSTFEAVANRSYCTEVAAAAGEASAATPGIEVFRSDGTTGVANGTRRACFVAPFTETTVVAVTQSDAAPRSHVLRIHETTLWANWFFTGADYSSFTLVRNTTNGVIHATLVWRDLAGTQRGSALNITLPAGGDAIYDARTRAGVGPGLSGSVEIAYDGESEGLMVSQTTLSAATGLSFDTLARPRTPW